MTAVRDPIEVRVGSGDKAHLFQPRPNTNAKVFALRDGMTVHGYVLCGHRGALKEANGLTMCKTCEQVLERNS